MTALKAVILDWAGTTVDFGCFAPAVAFVQAFKRAGVEITVAEARRPMGAAKRDHIAAICAMPRVAAAWREKHGGEPGETDVDELYSDFVPLQLRVIRDYSSLIPGTIEAAAEFRRRGLKIGTTTGYDAEMAAAVAGEARKAGFEPECVVSASDVRAGRPAPWMALLAAMHMGVYPMAACVKIGDTIPDIGEGLNAGMWSVGVAATGNEVGMTESELGALPAPERAAIIASARGKLAEAGAHYVVDSIADMPGVLDAIQSRLATGERP